MEPDSSLRYSLQEEHVMHRMCLCRKHIYLNVITNSTLMLKPEAFFFFYILKCSACSPRLIIIFSQFKCKCVVFQQQFEVSVYRAVQS